MKHCGALKAVCAYSIDRYTDRCGPHKRSSGRYTDHYRSVKGKLIYVLLVS